MYIKRLVINDFRNLQYAELEPSPGFNFICGPNGSGKTSILEAIHYLSLARSFRTSSYQYMIRQGSQRFNIFALLNEDNQPTDCTLGLSRARGEKPVMRLNSNPVARMVDLIDHICVQIIHPQGVELVTRESEGRRSFIDWGVYYTDPEFKALWLNYRKVLRQRNSLLRREAYKRKGYGSFASYPDADPALSSMVPQGRPEWFSPGADSMSAGAGVSGLSAGDVLSGNPDLTGMSTDASAAPIEGWDDGAVMGEGFVGAGAAVTGTSGGSTSAFSRFLAAAAAPQESMALSGATVPASGAAYGQGADPAAGPAAMADAMGGAPLMSGIMSPAQEISIWDESLAQLSEKITEKRLRYLEDLRVILQEIIGQFLPDFKIRFELNYGWDKSQDLRSLMARNLEKDKALGYTYYGCHRADLRIKNNTISAGATLSRGQLKMLVYALRLAQGMLLKQQTDRACIYLIDDLNSELDDNSQKILLNTLLQCNHQVFISNIQQELLFPKHRSEYKIFSLNRGMVTPDQTA